MRESREDWQCLLEDKHEEEEVSEAFEEYEEYDDDFDYDYRNEDISDRKT